MCGILVGHSNIDTKLYTKAMDAVAYRGPDAFNMKIFETNSGKIVLAHRRLSILDLDMRSNQPFCYRNRYWITYNGEVYNYIELKDELEKKGYQFHTSSDTEVLLIAYVHWGEAVLDKLNGMFSFVIFDNYTQSLFVARDRFGIKPLYYHCSNKGVFFASEVKQLLELMISSRRINQDAFLSFMAYGEFNIKKQTLLDDIHEFSEGSYLYYSLKSGLKNFNIKKWYELRLNYTNNYSDDHYHNIFETAVRLRLRSDVSLGGLLSGGIDSSAIALAMKKSLSTTPSFITMCYPNDQYDESKYAESVASSLKSPLTKVLVDVKNLNETLNNITYYFDYPILGRSDIPHYFLYKESRNRGFKVCLEGQGADETLYGYTNYQYAYIHQLIKAFKIRQAFSEIDSFAKNENVGRKYVISQLLQRAFPYFHEQRICKMLQKNFMVPLKETYGINRFKTSLDDVIRTRFEVLRSILHGVDRLSMASSIEARVPFLDHNVVEAFLGMPLQHKIEGGYRKLILRKYLEGSVDDSIVLRRDKQGFNAPEEQWVRKQLSEHIIDAIERSSSIGFLNSRYILNNFKNYLLGIKSYDRLYWRVFSFMKWCDIFKI